MHKMDMETLLPLDFDRGLAKFTILSENFHILENLTTSQMLSTCISVSTRHCPKITKDPRGTNIHETHCLTTTLFKFQVVPNTP